MNATSARHALPIAVLACTAAFAAFALHGQDVAMPGELPPAPPQSLGPAPEPATLPESSPNAPGASEVQPLPALADASAAPELASEVQPLPAFADASAAPELASEVPQTNVESADPCKQAISFKDAWLDKVRRGIFHTVCGSAAWFDNFFGDEHAYDPQQVYGRLSGGVLYEANGDWEDRTKFDANIPLPNLSKRTTAFLGRDNAEQYISDNSQELSAPQAFRDTSDERSWLAGFGYNPPGKRGARMSYRVGMKVSMDPYVFAQARYRYVRYTSKNTALRFHETFFYRTNDDQFGATTYLGYDWIPRRANLARISAQGTVSDDTEGLKWKSYATFYQDLALRSGNPRGISYQLFVNGETAKDVPIREYGFQSIYREQMFRDWFFGEISLGYNWVREEPVDHREGGVIVGFVFEILFGDYYDRR